MDHLYQFFQKRIYFIAFAFIVNVFIFSFGQQEYSSLNTIDRLVGNVDESIEESQEIIDYSDKNREKYKRALQEYDQSIELNQMSSNAHYNRGIALIHLGEYQKAMLSLRQADRLSEEGDYEIKNNLAISLSRLGRTQESLIEYDKAITMRPDDYRLYNNKGILLNQLGRYEESIDYFNRAIEINPIISKVYNNKGIALKNMGRLLESIKEYNKAIKLDPYNDKAYNNRGIAISKLE